MSKRTRLKTRTPASEGDRINPPKLNPRRGSSMGTGKAAESSDEQEDEQRPQPHDEHEGDERTTEDASDSRQAPDEDATDE